MFFHIGSQSRTFRIVWQHRQVPNLITDKLSLLVNYRVKFTGTSREECAGSTIPTLKLGGSSAPSSGPFRLARVSSARDEIQCRHMFLARSVGLEPTIAMVVHNNNDILMIHYEDLPNGDKGVISKAIEEFKSKCLLSYTKTRDNTIVQKFPLPRVLLYGQVDTTKAKDRSFFMEVVDKSVRDAISSQSEAFVDIFHNALTN